MTAEDAWSESEIQKAQLEDPDIRPILEKKLKLADRPSRQEITPKSPATILGSLGLLRLLAHTPIFADRFENSLLLQKIRSLHTRRFVSTGFENSRFFADDAYLVHSPIRVGRFYIGCTSGHSRIQFFFSEVKMNPKRIAAMRLLYRRVRRRRIKHRSETGRHESVCVQVALHLKDGVLYRKWENDDGSSCRWQLILPKSTIQEVLQETHDSASEGHFGIMKTLRRIRDLFYWDRLRSTLRNGAENVKFAEPEKDLKEKKESQ
ncbi:hypothetical protein AVEN_38358-1 [Araneus ventricosus]|uniref:Integrase zinc-binding domain-containing protein n=1 Tax=Araneus ventricosus TaxID=182803 RepID=A0A4Y2GTD5_ARAVE|nr:hypothetical protein AVEN_38358-1 [Araneus ventricosus]